MPSPIRRGLTFASICIACALSAAAISSAQPGVKPSASPSSVAIVDLAKVSATLQEAKALHARLGQQKEESEKQLKIIQDDLKAVIQTLELDKDNKEKKGTPEYLKLMAKRYTLESNLKANRDALQQLMDIAEGENMRTIYEKIVKAVEKIGRDQGFDLILWDDRAISAPEGPRTGAQVWSVIRDRRILFASDRVDVTQQVITVMDNDWKGGKK